MHRLLATVIAALATVAVIAAGVHLATRAEDPPDRAALRGGVVVDEQGPGEVRIVPPEGQAVVTGELRSAQIEDGVGPPLALPITLPARPGAWGATISDALVEGQRTTIVWDGGRPITFHGPGIDLGPARATIDAGGVTWQLDGAARSLVPGTFLIEGSVAIGRDGLAEPRDRVELDADQATLLATRGGIAVHTPPAPVRFEGPGQLVLEGHFEVETRSGTTTATLLRFGPGPFVVTLDPTARGWRMRATLQGPLEVDPGADR